MRKWTIIGWAVLLVAMATGCHTTVTNLTPSQQVRNKAGMYPLSVAWDSNQQSLQKETIEACVQVGLQIYPMQSTPLVKNRWETLVPVPADQSLLNYRFKFDYESLGMPHRRQNSRLSPPYQLKIIDP
ncbi:MAG TPA: hypothetical protein P5555_13250 [Candidatus Paceibacterota bacterium]|nr:hypothetical protein [Verrucomicrobiota bacterium]HRZ46150.1 hypothetical protein [Candidatus Paceibacterota bacterium]HRZ93404.1 hypothetical protein [Candidatus Paceibacterota bacterium]